MDPSDAVPRSPLTLKQHLRSLVPVIPLCVVLVVVLTTLDWGVLYLLAAIPGVALFAAFLASQVWLLLRRRKDPALIPTMRRETVTVPLSPTQALATTRRAILALPFTTLYDDAAQDENVVLAEGRTHRRGAETRVRARVVPANGTMSQVEIECWVPYRGVVTSFGKCQLHVNSVVAAVHAAEASPEHPAGTAS